MIFISYGTKATPYENVIKEYLLPSLEKFNLKYYIEYPEDLGSWQKNTHYKAEFIKKCLIKFKEPVIFIDSDATILQHPNLFEYLEDNGTDIGLHFLDWYKNWRNEKGDRFEALSGTMFLDYNEHVLKFLDKWIEKNNESMKWEQRNMQDVLDENIIALNIFKLPYSYCTVITHTNDIPKHMINKEEVVILHHQKSREFKNYKRKNL